MTTLRFRSAGTRIDLDGIDGGLADLLRSVGGPMLSDDDLPADRAVRLSPGRLPGPAAGEVVGSVGLNRAAAWALATIDRALLAASPCLHIHAAAVAGRVGAAVVPGVSGAGKSTLAGAAMQTGLRLVSDEAACVDPLADVLWPHPRPLGLSRHSRQLLGLPDPSAGASDEEYATAPGLLGACAATDTPVPARLVVLGVRAAGQEPALVPLDPGQGLAALLGNCLNTGTSSAWTAEAAWRRLVRLAQSVSMVRLTYDRPQDGARLLRQALD